MKKEVAVHTSDFSITSDLRNSDNFVPPHLYDPLKYSKLRKFEYGTLETDCLNFRIFLSSHSISTGCPWCSTEPVIKMIRPEEEFPQLGTIKMFAQCPNCLSRGPLLNIFDNPISANEHKEHFKDWVLSMYKQRFNWDHYLKEEINK